LLYLNKTTEELLTLSKNELLSFLIEEAKCSQEDISKLLTRPKREVLEFLIERLRNRAVNLDYEMLLEVLSADKDFLDELRYTVVKTVAVSLECEIIENVIDIKVIAQDIVITVEKKEIQVEIIT